MEEIFSLDSKSCQRFSDSPSGRSILFNSDIERFVILYEPKLDELRELLLDYTRRRIDEIWAAMANVVVKDDRIGLAAFTQAEGNRVVMLRAEALRRSFPGLYSKTGKGKPSEGIHKFISFLPLDQQRKMLEDIHPKSYSELPFLFTSSRLSAQFAYEPISLLGGYSNFKNFLLVILGKIRNRDRNHGAKGNKDTNVAARHQDILFMMSIKKWVLLPVRYGSYSSSPGVVGQYDRFMQCGCYLPKESHELITAACKIINVSRRNSEIALRTMRIFLFSSTIRSVDEISVTSVAFFEQTVAVKIPASAGFSTGAYTAGDTLRTIFESKFPDQLFPAYRVTRDDSDLNRKSPTFKRVAIEFPDKLELIYWGDLFSKFVVARQQRTMTHIVYNMWRFLTYLATLTEIPATPAHIVRHIHIRNISGGNNSSYFYYLECDSGSTK